MRLRYSKRALQQIDQALGYIAEQSPQGAAKVEARLMIILTLLRHHPHTGSKTPISGVRRIFLTPYPYLIDYYCGNDEIVVQRFRHIARRPVA
ncbi:type II toxin-antitoxin system RelE/ParE family toxin [Pararhizobium sp. LjRoot235]|uniref:type II toxin-antitoxin system RelE/ParE family toxin n=1 Tax=Pararhizobium sp. LjRoot235 TaxID=3342291 RepID=UPI003ECEC0E2